jgi:hypothetical protein
MDRVCLSPLPSLDLQQFIFSCTVRFLEKNNLTQNVLFNFSLQLLYEKLTILRRTERDMIMNVHLPSCKVPVIFVVFHWNLNFLYSFFSKNTKISNFVKIHPVGGRVVACGQTDVTERISLFCERALKYTSGNNDNNNTVYVECQN